MPRSVLRKKAKKASANHSSGSGSDADADASPDLRRQIAKQYVMKEREKVDFLFKGYENKTLGLIDPDGIVKLCTNLFKVDHTDVRVLALAWKMKAKKPGFFTIEEWRHGLKELRADSTSKLKKAFNEIEKEISAPKDFLDFYQYAFQYCLTEHMQKSVDTQSICELLKIVLGPKYPHQVESLVEYLKDQTEYKVLTKDQWVGFLNFCQEVHFPSLDNYDADLAWPLVLDNFVDWLKEKRG